MKIKATTGTVGSLRSYAATWWRDLPREVSALRNFYVEITYSVLQNFREWFAFAQVGSRPYISVSPDDMDFPWMRIDLTKAFAELEFDDHDAEDYRDFAKWLRKQANRFDKLADEAMSRTAAMEAKRLEHQARGLADTSFRYIEPGICIECGQPFQPPGYRCQACRDLNPSATIDGTKPQATIIAGGSRKEEQWNHDANDHVRAWYMAKLSPPGDES